MLNSLTDSLYTFTAKDSKRDDQTRRVEVSNFSDNAGGLPKTLVLGIGARVILTKNLDVSDGLVNSAAGVVTGFIPEPTENNPDYQAKFILVKFNDERVGNRRREEHKSVLPRTKKDSTPISQVEIPVPLGKSSKITCKRTQFPLTHAWGITIHKEQGKTEDTLVLSIKGSFHPGQFYTAISRTKTLDGLFILEKVDSSKVKVNQSSLQEIKRMKKESEFIHMIPLSLEKNFNVFLKISFLNISSMLPHFSSLLKDNIIQQSHIMLLAETWLIPTDDHPQVQNYSCLRSDFIPTHRRHRSGGLISYIHRDLYFVLQYEKELEFQYQMYVVSPAEDRSIRFVIMNVYNNPRNKIKNFLCALENMLNMIPMGMKAVVVGDFNIDISSRTTQSKNLLELLRYYGFRQLSSSPTHRRGGIIDHFYTNIHSDDVVMSIIPVYYSDHQILSAAIPFKCLC